MKKLILIVAVVLFTSCGSSKVISTQDITGQTAWLESSKDNPIINVVQRVYSNDDVEIVIKKKLTTDYVNIRQTKSKRSIIKTTVTNEKVN